MVRNNEPPIDRAIALCGGASALAGLLEIAPSTPLMWRARGRVPAEYCPGIERLTQGAVRCEDLRPDVDWSVLRAPAVRGENTTSTSADKGRVAIKNEAVEQSHE